MPWTIWPALVVLWGVCWMFIQKDNAADKDNSHRTQQEQAVNAEVDWSTLANYLSFDFPTANMTAYDPTFQGLDFDGHDYRSGFTAADEASAALLTTTSDESPVFSPSPHRLTQSYLKPDSLTANSSFPISQSTHLDAAQPYPRPKPAPTAFSRSTVTATSPLSLGLPQSSRLSLHATPRDSNLRTGTITCLSPTKSAPFRCPACGGQFVRKETLDRHMREQMHGEGVAESGDPEEYLCPNMECRKSVKDRGFKRRDKLQEHLRNESCKPHRRLSKTQRRLASVVPFAAPTPHRPPFDISRGGASLVPSDGIPSDEGFGTNRDITVDGASDEASSPESTLVAQMVVSVERSPEPVNTNLTLLETPRTAEHRSGKLTILERIAFHERCCEGDEEDLRVVGQEIRAMEEELRAKQQESQRIHERIAASRNDIEMLRRQQGT